MAAKRKKTLEVDPFVLSLIEEMVEERFGESVLRRLITIFTMEEIMKQKSVSRREIFKKVIAHCIKIPEGRAIIPEVFEAMDILEKQKLGRFNNLSYEKMAEELLESEIFKTHCRDFIKQYIIYFI